MKLLTVSSVALLATAALWVTHLPSANPINGSFIAMCAALGMVVKALSTMEETQENIESINESN